MKESVAVQYSWLEDFQHSIEETCGSQRGEEAGGIEGQPEARGRGEKAEGEDTKWAEGE